MFLEGKRAEWNIPAPARDSFARTLEILSEKDAWEEISQLCVADYAKFNLTGEQIKARLESQFHHGSNTSSQDFALECIGCVSTGGGDGSGVVVPAIPIPLEPLGSAGIVTMRPPAQIDLVQALDKYIDEFESRKKPVSFYARGWLETGII